MLDWAYPQTVETVTSKHNGQIKVVKNRGEYSVWVGGFEQSGNFYVQKIWKKKLDTISRNIKSVLILGLGCGTVAGIVGQKWPKAKIVGVEIDPVMIGLGKKYFGLGRISSLKIVNQDARDFIKSTNRKFDLILVDAYIGNKKKNIVVPQGFLNKGGVMITNKLIGLENELVVKFNDV